MNLNKLMKRTRTLPEEKYNMIRKVYGLLRDIDYYKDAKRSSDGINITKPFFIGFAASMCAFIILFLISYVSPPLSEYYFWIFMAIFCGSGILAGLIYYINRRFRAEKEFGPMYRKSKTEFESLLGSSPAEVIAALEFIKDYQYFFVRDLLDGERKLKRILKQLSFRASC